jgi:DNA (cytosine-5)-methyltransferase 1
MQPAVAMINMQGSKGNSVAQEDGPSFTLNAMHGHDVHAVAFHTSGYGGQVDKNVAQTLQASDAKLSNQVSGVIQKMQVRRLTPTECERLQGVPDGHTLVPFNGKPMADGNRYKMIGNGFAIPCVKWIGKRIQMVEDMLNEHS